MKEKTMQIEENHSQGNAEFSDNVPLCSEESEDIIIETEEEMARMILKNSSLSFQDRQAIELGAQKMFGGSAYWRVDFVDNNGQTDLDILECDSAHITRRYGPREYSPTFIVRRDGWRDGFYYVDIIDQECAGPFETAKVAMLWLDSALSLKYFTQLEPINMNEFLACETPV